jgi:hypothetical protein
MKNNFIENTKSRSKRLTWREFNFLDGRTPPLTSDGKKYICSDIYGNMQVCVWSHHSNEFVYFNGDLTTSEMLEAALEAVLDVINEIKYKKNQKNTKHFDLIYEEVFELALDKLKTFKGIAYFDCVEWYMELPETPPMAPFTVNGDSEIQAEIFDQELLLMEHLERAVKDFVYKTTRIHEEEKNEAS